MTKDVPATGGPSMVYGADALRAHDAFSGGRTG
jgi:hypothetical protein